MDSSVASPLLTVSDDPLDDVDGAESFFRSASRCCLFFAMSASTSSKKEAMSLDFRGVDNDPLEFSIGRMDVGLFRWRCLSFLCCCCRFLPRLSKNSSMVSFFLGPRAGLERLLFSFLLSFFSFWLSLLIPLSVCSNAD